MHDTSVLIPEMQILHLFKDLQLPKTPPLPSQEKPCQVPGVTWYRWHRESRLQEHTWWGAVVPGMGLEWVSGLTPGSFYSLCGHSSKRETSS